MRIFEIEDQGNPKELLKFIKENCQPWHSQVSIGHHQVYRGISYESIQSADPVPGEFPVDEVFQKPIRKDRRALGLKFYREIYDKILTDLGAQARRENSVPVIANETQAGKFGIPHVFMPIGLFSYAWSTVLLDWGSFKLADPDDFKKFREANLAKEWESVEDSAYKYIKPTVRFDKLTNAIQSGHEIFIAADSGLYIEPSIYQHLFKDFQK